jgi:hypothetical protein
VSREHCNLLSYSQRLRIWETNYGRGAGWIIEREGKPLAILSDCRYEDMFWDSYRIQPITEDADGKRMLTQEFWTGSDWVGLTWRNRDFDLPPLAPFPAGEPIREPGRVTVRGLYLPIGDPRWWDRLVLWVRRWRRRTAL